MFDQLERAALLALPPTPWVLAEWKQAKLHADCHVVFAGAYYSAPHRLIGQRLWVRATAGKVELFHEYALVATHRPARPGQRRTLNAHLPPDKVHFLLQTPAWCRDRAAAIGPACAQFIDALLGERPLDRLRGAQGVLRLAQRVSADGRSLENAEIGSPPTTSENVPSPMAKSGGGTGCWDWRTS